MVRSYQLKKGRYFVGDPGYLIKKTPAGDKFIEKLWDSFYSDMNSFHKLVIDHITIYVTRTAEGDGFFDGIATDTGAIAIIDINQVLMMIVFRLDQMVLVAIMLMFLMKMK